MRVIHKVGKTEWLLYRKSKNLSKGRGEKK